jgi:hypothetical protein
MITLREYMIVSMIIPLGDPLKRFITRFHASGKNKTEKISVTRFSSAGKSVPVIGRLFSGFRLDVHKDLSSAQDLHQEP